MLKYVGYFLFRICTRSSCRQKISFVIQQASAPDNGRRRWKWKKCWRDGARSAPAATLDANIRIPLSARKCGITGKKVAPRIRPMSRCTAVPSLHRIKARKHRRINEFAISFEEGRVGIFSGVAAGIGLHRFHILFYFAHKTPICCHFDTKPGRVHKGIGTVVSDSK